MNKLLSLSAFLLCSFVLSAQFSPFQKGESYEVLMDLRHIKDDKLSVEIVPPIIMHDSVEYHMPRVIPGTYSIENYGQFITEFKATDGQGKALDFKKLDENRWRIYNAKKLYKISYKVDDSFDLEGGSSIFEPAGTSLEDSVYLLNNFGFVGYVEAYKNYEFRLNITKPNGFYGSTSLEGEMGDTLDVFTASDYFHVHDNPIMYCAPDTAVKKVGGAEVMVSVYSPTHEVSAKECMSYIAEVLDAASVYLGGELPVDKYSVLIYCVPLSQAGTSYGALEHHTSTVLYMPEFGGEQFYNGVRDITSHEFFHIVTPLNIHSEQIANFDFINPKMSKHIWLYEGVTEYNSHLVQVRNNIYNTEEFLDILAKKISDNDDYNADIPLTVSSEFTLSYFKNQYHNFYQKGAISGLALDLKLRQHNTHYGLVNLLEDLSKTYGADTFFIDDNLFDIITEMTFPEMREFFARYYEGAESFPLAELFSEVGVHYFDEIRMDRISGGNIAYGYNFETGRIRAEDVSEVDAFGKALGIQQGDEIVSFNGSEITLNNISDVMSAYYAETKVGDKVEMKVARPQADGATFKTVKLKAKAQMGSVTYKHILELEENPNASQKEKRKAWINQ